MLKAANTFRGERKRVNIRKEFVLSELIFSLAACKDTH